MHQKLTCWPCFPLIVVRHTASSNGNLWSLPDLKALASLWIWGIYPPSPPHCNLRWRPVSWPIILHLEQVSHCASILSCMSQWPTRWNRINCRKYLLHQNWQMCCNGACDFLQLYQVVRFFVLRYTVVMLSHAEHSLDAMHRMQFSIWSNSAEVNGDINSVIQNMCDPRF